MNALNHKRFRWLCRAAGMGLCITAALFVPWCCIEAQSGDVAARLTKIRNDVAATEKVIEELKGEFNKLKKEEKGLEADIRRLSEEEQTMLNESTQVVRKKEKLVVDLRSAEQRVSQQQALIRERLRVLYMSSSVNERAMVLGSAQTGQVERVAVYAGAVRRHDQLRFKDVVQAVESLETTRRALDRALEEGKLLQVGLQTKRTELENQKTKLRGVMQQIQGRQQAAKRSLATLTAEADKLEALLRTIMSAGDSEDSQAEGESPTAMPKDPAERVPPRDAADSDVGVRTSNVMHPGGLFAQTARIAYPVTGEVVQRFGANKVTNFSDMVFSKGVEYKTPEGSQVKAVLGGRVAFAGVMPGFDTVVIIDHGERSYSLYGRLGKSHVKQGDLVQRKDVLGVTSTADTKGRNFYFETRKNGSPVDPVSVLSRAS
jgi:septal ring factor EnvC (AmiA/AmiB activator)